MNQMEIFKNPEFGSIRTFEQDGKVLFCGTDVATALGYANPRKAVRDHTRCGTKCSIGVQTGKKADGTPAVQMVEMLFIPEGDVYRLIVHSKLPSAERFERWVFDEVLPSIRQHGAYPAAPGLSRGTGRRRPVKIRIIDFGLPENHRPLRSHANDAGADVYMPFDCTLEPGGIAKIPLGFGLEVPDGYAAYVFPRSSLAAKGVVCELPPVDSGYRGEIHAIVSNVGNETQTLAKDSRIGQLIIMPVVIADFVNDLGGQRGAGAFGSTGE